MLSTLLLAGASLLASAQPLLLTPLIQQGKLEEARNLSVVTGGFGHSAFLTVPSKSGKQSNNIYFWFQPCTGGCDASTAPFLLWFQGGPGGPGTFGAFGEIGNWYVDENYKIQERCFSWCKKYNCLFVDQPVITGFSFALNSSGKVPPPKEVEYTRTSQDATEQVHQVLLQFFQVFPEYKPAPFWITGESYGGLYTSWMGTTIVAHNRRDPPASKINLVGIAVGDPVLDWGVQMPTYASTLYGMGLLSVEERDDIAATMQRAVSALAAGKCVESFNEWNSVWNDDGGLGTNAGKYYTYTGSNITEDSLLSVEPPSLDFYDKFVQNEDVQKAFHIYGLPSIGFDEGGLVYSTMVQSGDFCSNATWLFAKLFLEEGIELMIYSSTADPLLGPPTTEAGVGSLFKYATEFIAGGDQAQKAYKAAPKTHWKVQKTDTDVAGYSRCITRPGASNRFCYGVVRNAGHMTPAFQPRASYDLVNRFIQGRSFDATGDLPDLPQCAQCGGAPPFAGPALPACVCGK